MGRPVARRKTILRRPDPNDADGWLYFRGTLGTPWAPRKEDAFHFDNDYAAARVIIIEDVRDAVLINA